LKERPPSRKRKAGRCLDSRVKPQDREHASKFEFIQVEKVTERALPRVLVFSLRDGDMLISNEVLVTFDSTSDSMEERKRPVKLMVKKGAYDKAREYALVLRDPETQIEYDRIPVT
jgi:hypothetical protein